MRFFLRQRYLDKGLQAATVLNYRANAAAVGCPIVRYPVREMKGYFIKPFLTEQIFCWEFDVPVPALPNIILIFKDEKKSRSP